MPKAKKIKSVKKQKPTKKIKKQKIKVSKKVLKEQEKQMPQVDVTKRISQTVQESLNQIKNEMLEKEKPVQEIEVRKTPYVLDKVYLQSITFEIASMRQALDRIGQKLDKLEKELAAHRKGE
jgi:hypothetical protein